MRENAHAHISANGTTYSSGGFQPLFKDFDYKTLQNQGYEESKNVNGTPSLLENFLGALCDYDRTSGDRRREIFRADEHGLSLHEQVKIGEENIKSLQIEEKQEEARANMAIKQREEEIFDKKIEIQRIRNGDYGLVGKDVNPANRLAYYFCAIILSALSIYLVLFYVSVIYNAFILDVGQAAASLTDQSTGFSSMTIVNLKSLPKVWYADGLLGVFFLLSSAFMFLGLGFLIHWLTHRKSWWWLVGLYLFTFVFDAFLAYEIVKKIHESEVMIGLSEAGAWSGLSFAFLNSVFWIILFAGFSMYIIWGFLLRYLLDEHYKILPARVAIRHRKAQIKKLKEEITGLRQQMAARIGVLRQEILRIEQQQIAKLRNDIEKNDKTLRDLRTGLKDDLTQSGFSYQDMQNRIVPFFTGWCQYLTEQYKEEAASRVTGCQAVLNNFYRKIGLT